MSTQVSRRAMMLALGVSGLLAGCSGVSPATISAIAAAAFAALKQDAALVLPQLENAGLNLGSISQVQGWLTAMEQAAAGITAASTQVQGQSVLQTIETYANDIAPAVEVIAPLVPGGAVIGLVFAALPELEALVNLGTSLLIPAVATVAKTAPPLPAGGRFGAAASSTSRINQLIALAAQH